MPWAFSAAFTRFARSRSKGLRRSRVLATGSSMASAGTSDLLGCRAAESWMWSAPTSRANATHSSIARSGSASRLSRGVSSCRAAVSTPIFMNFGSKGATGMGSSIRLSGGRYVVRWREVKRPLRPAPPINERRRSGCR